MIKRILLGIGIGLVSILIGFLMLFYAYKTAPQESLSWLEINPIWNILIIGCFSFSNIAIGIHNGINLSDKILYSESEDKTK
jgi:hypothetical protein